MMTMRMMMQMRMRMMWTIHSVSHICRSTQSMLFLSDPRLIEKTVYSRGSFGWFHHSFISSSKRDQSETESIVHRHCELEKQIRYHRQQYEEGNPSISDQQFDGLLDQLLQLENSLNPELISHSPSQEVANPMVSSSSRRPIVRHLRPMLGLENAYSSSDLQRFFKRLQKAIQQQQQPLLLPLTSNQSPVDQNLSLPPLQITTETKYDGVALSLLFQRKDKDSFEWRIERAATRGDGKRGEEVTFIISQLIRNIPSQLKLKGAPYSFETTIKEAMIFEIRGEVVISRSDFSTLPSAQSSASPRNFVAAALRRHLSLNDLKLSHQPYLDFMAYDLEFFDDDHLKETSETKDQPFDDLSLSLQIPKRETQVDHVLLINSHWHRLQLLQWLGFTIDHRLQLHNSFESVIEEIRINETLRHQFEYEADGIVIKANCKRFQRIIGSTSRFPRSQIAFKFDQPVVETTLKDIRWQVNRSGKCSPVADLQPISLSGSTVSRVSLYNLEFVKRLNLYPGCRVVVQRSGGVIPKILSSVSPSPTPSSTSSILSFEAMIEPEPLCPCPLHRKLSRRLSPQKSLSETKELKSREEDTKEKEEETEEETENNNVEEIVCDHQECPERLCQQLLHFCKAVGLEGLAESTLRLFIERKLIRSINDLLLFGDPNENLRDQLLQLPKMGPKKVKNISQSICCADYSMANVLFGLGLSALGRSACQKIVLCVPSFDQLFAMDQESLKTTLTCLSSTALSSLTDFVETVKKSRLERRDESFDRILVQIDHLHRLSTDDRSIHR